jgi:hypothetical protein
VLIPLALSRITSSIVQSLITRIIKSHFNDPNHIWIVHSETVIHNIVVFDAHK